MPISFRPALLCAVIAAAAITAPSPASAQPFPDETITGTIQGWTSDETLKVADDRGFVDTVSLSEQTSLVAGREALVVGARVSIRGYNGGNWFDAERIELAGAAPQAPAFVPPPLPAPEPMPQTLPAPVYAPAIPSYSFTGPAPVAVYVAPMPSYAFSVGVVGGGYRGGAGYNRGGSVQVLELQGSAGYGRARFGGGYARFGRGQLRARFAQAYRSRAGSGGGRFRR